MPYEREALVQLNQAVTQRWASCELANVSYLVAVRSHAPGEIFSPSADKMKTPPGGKYCGL